jgi:hypothetical protein
MPTRRPTSIGIDSDSLCFQSRQRTGPLGRRRSFWRGQVKYGFPTLPVNPDSSFRACFTVGPFPVPRRAARPPFRGRTGNLRHRSERGKILASASRTLRKSPRHRSREQPVSGQGWPPTTGGCGGFVCNGGDTVKRGRQGPPGERRRHIWDWPQRQC